MSPKTTSTPDDVVFRPDVEALIEEAKSAIEFMDDLDYAIKNDNNKPIPEDYGLESEELVQVLLRRMVEALSALSGETETEALEAEQNRPHYEFAVRGCDCGGCFGEPIPEVVV